LEWRNGASGYTVYRATSSTGTYTLILTTAAKNYNNTGLKTGTTYYYKIRAYRTAGTTRTYGSYSSVVSSKPILSAPISIKAASSSYNHINVSWSGVTGASGYEVYKAASSTGIYSLVSTTTSINFTNTALLAGTIYYYKVRAYRTVGSSKVYSNFSYAVSGTTVSNPVVNVASVSLSKVTDNLIVGDTDTLTVSIAPANATNQAVTWVSSDDTIATVDNAGKVTAVSAGTATITATTVDESKTAKCTVTVNNAEIKGIDVSKWQGIINWNLVRSDGVQFAMIRSSYGDGTSSYINNGVDPMFETYYAAAKANGISVGAYHYSYATTVAQATKEANFFISRPLAGTVCDFLYIYRYSRNMAVYFNWHCKRNKWQRGYGHFIYRLCISDKVFASKWILKCSFNTSILIDYYKICVK